MYRPSGNINLNQTKFNDDPDLLPSNIFKRYNKKEVKCNGVILHRESQPPNLNPGNAAQIFPTSLIDMPKGEMHKIAGYASLSNSLRTELANEEYARDLRRQNPDDRALPDEFVTDEKELSRRYLQNQLKNKRAKDLDMLEKYHETRGSTMPRDELARILDTSEAQRMLSDPETRKMAEEAHKKSIYQPMIDALQNNNQPIIDALQNNNQQQQQPQRNFYNNRGRMYYIDDNNVWRHAGSQNPVTNTRVVRQLNIRRLREQGTGAAMQTQERGRRTAFSDTE